MKAIILYALIVTAVFTACSSPQTNRGEVPMSNTDTAVQIKALKKMPPAVPDTLAK